MIVDWLSFIVGVKPTGYEQAAMNIALRSIEAQVPELFTWLMLQDKVSAPGRRPYSVSYEYGSVKVYAGMAIDHALVELSGTACEQLRQAGIMSDIIEAIKDDCTRVDIALDILGARPDEIVAKGYSSRFKGHTRIASETGITHYIGSQKSERYCRVYRYAPPHPRADLCRVEMVHRKRYAKIAASAIARDGIANAGLAALQSYQFKSELIPKDPEKVLATVAIVKGSQSTLRWLIVQVAPAFHRLVQEGTIENPGEFLQKHFLD